MKVYLDMDDVLVNYAHNVAKHYNLTMDELYANWTPGVYQIYHALKQPDPEVWREIRSQPPEFWASMPQFAWSRELFDLCNSLGETWILTSPINAWSCAAGKVQWLHEFAGDDFYQYHIGKAKWDLARWDKILIDDKEDNINQFRREGGIGILFPAHGNELHKHKNDPMSVVVPQLKENVERIKAKEIENNAFWAAMQTR